MLHIALGHQDLTNQHRIGSNALHPIEVIAAEQTRFTHQQRAALSHLHLHFKITLEKALIGDHRQAAGSTGGIGLSDGLGVKI